MTFSQSLPRLRLAALVLFGRHCLSPAHPALYAFLRSFCPSGPGFALRLPFHIGSHLMQLPSASGSSDQRPLETFTPQSSPMPGVRKWPLPAN